MSLGTLVTLRGTPTYTAGKFGDALSSGVLSAETATAWDAPVGTAEVWVKTSTDALKVAVGSAGTGSDLAVNGVWIGVGETGKAAFGWGVGQDSIANMLLTAQQSVFIADGSWHHLAVTFDGTKMRFWVDGSLNFEKTMAGSYRGMYWGGTPGGGTAPAIGGCGTSASYDWSGALDEIRISSVVRYSAAFTPPTSEFADDADTIALYHATAPPDTTAPAWTATLTTGTPTATSVEVAASALATDAMGVTGYEWTLDSTAGTPVYAAVVPSGLNFALTGLAAATTYANCALRAFDAAGNRSTALAVPSFTTASNVMAPTDPAIIYSPFTWDVTGARAKTINIGAYFRFSAACSGATLNLDTTALTGDFPVISYRVDGGAWQRANISASFPLTIPAGTSWGVHHFEVALSSSSISENRWNEPSAAHLTLTGITLSAGGTLRPAVARTRRGVWFGDSITEGEKTRGTTWDTDDSDAVVNWPYLVGSRLGEFGIVACGGLAWSGNGIGNWPAFTSSWDDLRGGGPARDISTADYVVVNMGENGGAVASTVTSWLQACRTALTSATTPIFVLRPFSGAGAAALQAGVTATGDANVHYVDTTGWFNSADSPDGQHPYGYVSLESFAPRLHDAIAAVIGGTASATPTRFYRASSGVATPVVTA